MKVYISASYVAQKRLRPCRDALWAMGHEVTSSWLDETAPPQGMAPAAFQRKLAIKDVAEIVAADLLINDHLESSTTGGRDVEYGVALGRHQHVQLWTVGGGHSPFHELADRRFKTWKDVLLAAKKLARG